MTEYNDLRQYESIPLSRMTHEAREAISNAYLSYFDTLSPRERAIGYMVVYAGVPPLRIGLIDLGIRATGKTCIHDGEERKQAVWALFIGNSGDYMTDARLEEVVN